MNLEMKLFGIIQNPQNPPQMDMEYGYRLNMAMTSEDGGWFDFVPSVLFLSIIFCATVFD